MNDGYIMMVNKGSILLMYGLEWQILWKYVDDFFWVALFQESSIYRWGVTNTFSSLPTRVSHFVCEVVWSLCVTCSKHGLFSHVRGWPWIHWQGFIIRTLSAAQMTKHLMTCFDHGLNGRLHSYVSYPPLAAVLGPSRPLRFDIRARNDIRATYLDAIQPRHECSDLQHIGKQRCS
jgi:hypothetical protein